MLLYGAALPNNSTASAEELKPPAPVANPQRRGENGEMLKRSPAAVTGAVTLNSDINANLDGGDRRGAAYLQRVGLISDADLDQLIGWRGASAHISIHLINGTGLSGRRVANILTVSGLEALPAARLFNLWVEQKLGPSTTLRAGQFTAGQEFAISATAGLFVNSSFGWPASFATDLPSGGPAYPLAAPGIRVTVMPSEGLVLRLAVFAGDPAGPGSADPQRRDVHGFNGLRFAGKQLFIGEISRSAPGEDPASTVTLGGWVHNGDFPDVALDDPNAPSTGPASTVALPRHRSNWSFYAIADTRFWRSGQHTLRGFARVTAGPAGRNLLDIYLDGGVSLSAPLRGRENDTIGVAFAVGRISPRLRAEANMRGRLTAVPLCVPNFEGIIEATYQVKLSPRAYLQPNVQVVVHPAAALLAGVPIMLLPSHAVVVGLRSSLRL